MSNIDRRSVLVMSLLGAAMGLPAARAQTAPSGYPDIYRQIIADAEREGSLLIYSIMSPENWRPVIEGFNKLYPKIKVETLDLPASRESFERYLAERSTNSRTCDLIATADPGGWIDFTWRWQDTGEWAGQNERVEVVAAPQPLTSFATPQSASRAAK